jgi:hypothetical protein
MRIFSSAEKCRRVARRMSLIASSDGGFSGPDFCLIFAPCGYYDQEILSSLTAPRLSTLPRLAARRRTDWAGFWGDRRRGRHLPRAARAVARLGDDAPDRGHLGRVQPNELGGRARGSLDKLRAASCPLAVLATVHRVWRAFGVLHLSPRTLRFLLALLSLVAGAKMISAFF